MDPKECLKKAKELVDAFEKLNIDYDGEGILILRLFVQAVYPSLTVRDFIER